jgi:glutathione S-transferase
MAAPNIKIVYYDARGRAEVIRLTLAAGGIKWEEVLMTDEMWKTEKAKTPFGQLPLMEVDGKIFAQSIALANFAAREAGLYGKNNLDALKIDQVVQLVNDCLNIVVQVFTVSDEAKKEEQLKHFTEVDAPKYFAMYEKLLKDNGTGYFVGDSLTLADIFVYDQIFSPSFWKHFNADGFPLLIALKQTIEGHEKVKAYLATRKQKTQY